MTTRQFRLPRAFGMQFLETLRANRFKKRNGVLMKGIPDSEKCEYCTLGVAAKIAGCEIHPDEGFLHPYVYSKDGHRYTRNFGNLPEALRGNLVDGLPYFITTNNDEGKNFPQMADLIEENTEFYDENEQCNNP